MLCATIPEEINSYSSQIRYFQSPAWLTNFLGIYRNTRKRLLTGEEISQRQVHHQNSPQHRSQLVKAGNLGHTASPTGGMTGWKVSFPGSSEPLLRSLAALFFYTVQQVSAFSRQLSLAVACNQLCWPEHLLAQFVLKSLSSLYC